MSLQLIRNASAARRLGLTVLTAAALLSVSATRLGAESVSPEWVQNWQDDLRFFSRQLPRIHPDPFTVVSRADFESRIDGLIEAAPEMTHEELVVGLAQVVAALGDGHTRVTLPLPDNADFFLGHSKTPPPDIPGLVFDYLPLRLVLLDDGLLVRSAAREHAEAVGATVVEIGGMAVEEAIAAVSPVVHRDNRHQLAHQLPDYVVLPEVLAAVGVAEPGEPVELTLAPASGDPFVVTLAPVPHGQRVDWVEAVGTSSATPPLYLRDNDRKFWFEHLREERAVYFQYNEVGDEEQETLAAFAERLFAYVEQNPVDKLIVDLRRNRGGNNGLNQALLHGLIRSDKLREPGSLFVLTGGATFSAAMMFCVDLANNTQAIFVGSPTGSSPNHYGDSRKLRLPRTGLTVRVSTLEWQYADPRDDRKTMEPHLPVPSPASEYLRAHDAALQTILQAGAPIGPDPAHAGSWQGRVSVWRWTFDFTVELSLVDSGWSGTIDIPELGLENAGLEEVTVANGTVHFVLPDRGSERRFVFDGHTEGRRIYGSFSYNSRSTPFVLSRG